VRRAAAFAALAAWLAATAAAGAPAEDRPTLVGSFLQLCGADPSDPDRILAAAARQGWKPVPADETPAAWPGFTRTAVWSKADGSRGHLFLILGHGESPYLNPAAVADICQVAGQIRGVAPAVKTLIAWAGSPSNTTVPGQKTYLFANDASGLNRIGSPDPDAAAARLAVKDGKVGLVSFVTIAHGGTITYFVQRN
jgi:hypothetical protein